MTDLNQTVAEPVSSTPSTPLEDFTKTSTAANLSGNYNKISGILKSKYGKLTENPLLEKEGSDQKLLGQLHLLVGSLRSAKEEFTDRVKTTGKDCQEVLRTHGFKFLKGATNFVDDLKTTLLK